MTDARVKIAVICLMCIIAALLPSGCDEQTTGTYATQIGSQSFTLETAISEEKRNQGLMGRTEIADDGGMIFIFNDDAERSFWMKNCLVDIDIIYIDRAGFVVSCWEMKRQPAKAESETEFAYEDRIRRTASYPSEGKARYVIELKAGKIRALGLKKGDKIDLDLDRLKAMGDADDGR